MAGAVVQNILVKEKLYKINSPHSDAFLETQFPCVEKALAAQYS